MDEWENFAKKLKANAEQRAVQNDKPEEGMYIDHVDIIKEIAARWESQM